MERQRWRQCAHTVVYSKNGAPVFFHASAKARRALCFVMSTFKPNVGMHTAAPSKLYKSILLFIQFNVFEQWNISNRKHLLHSTEANDVDVDRTLKSDFGLGCWDAIDSNCVDKFFLLIIQRIQLFKHKIGLDALQTHSQNGDADGLETIECLRWIDGFEMDVISMWHRFRDEWQWDCW